MKAQIIIGCVIFVFCLLHVKADNQTDVVQLLHNLNVKLDQVYMLMTEQIESAASDIHELKQSVGHVGWLTESLDRSINAVELDNAVIRRNLSLLTAQSDSIMLNQQYCANHDALKDMFFELTPKCGEGFRPNSTLYPPSNRVYRSCSEAPRASGVYRIALDSNSNPFEAYCEQERYGGNWMVFQARMDGSVNFNRTFVEYRNGFGKASGEHWLGLEKMFLMTQNQNAEMLILLENYTNFEVYERYPSFKVNSEANRYILTLNQAGHGTAGDSLFPYRQEAFVTYENSTCGLKMGCGFWHYQCDSISSSKNNLNGLYHGSLAQGIWWGGFGNGQPFNYLKRVRMMMKVN